MATCFRRVLMTAAVLVSTPVTAQGVANVRFYQSAARAGGQADGLSVACGKVSVATTKAHRAKMRQDYAAKGLAPETFDGIYDSAFADMVSKGKSNPTQLKAACDRVAAIGSRRP